MGIENGLVVVNPVLVPETLHKTNNSVTVKQNTAMAGGYVEHIGLDEVMRIMAAARTGKYGERNALLIGLLFDSCLRISELLELTPERIDRAGGRILAENLKRGSGKVEISYVGLSHSIMSDLGAYCFDNRAKIADDQRIFNITRFRAHQIISQAMQKAGIVQPEHTGRVHVMRHSGALALLAATGNIQLVRGQLRHSQINMSMNYLKTYARDEAVKAKGSIDLWKSK